MNACKITKTCSYPSRELYEGEGKEFQGIPTITVTKGGRIFAGWLIGGYHEPCIDNKNFLVYSDDGGETWTPVFMTFCDKEKGVHSWEIQVQVDSDNVLHVMWNQKPASMDEFIDGLKTGNFRKCDAKISGWFFDWSKTYEWEVVCKDPDAEVLEFSQPRFLFKGLYRNNWTDLSDGSRLYCASEFWEYKDKEYRYYISYDKGETFEEHFAGDRIYSCFDEAMVYEEKDGTWRLVARSGCGSIAQCFSKDKGKTWSKSEEIGFLVCDSRSYIGKTPKGNALFVYNAHPSIRKNMTVALSLDDGKTFDYKQTVDRRDQVSYPDVGYFEDKIYLIYDRERQGAKDIIMAIFTEEDIIKNRPLELKVINKNIGLE